MAISILVLSLVIWLYLLLFWGKFWLCDRRIDRQSNLKTYSTVWAIVPARDEEEVIADSLTSLLKQKYPGNFNIVLVDDNSRDRTSEIARQLDADKLTIISGKPLAEGWKGKLWAMQQGIDYARQQIPQPNYFLFTDADIYHDPDNLRQLVTKAETEDLDLVSVMVLLHCKSFWEKLLIPAFVFFFQKLYPFPWVNNPDRSTAAAGGCVLISSRALSDMGGIATIKDALIDDCSLAKAVKSRHKIWLGLTKTTISLHDYNNLKTIWDTISRTAYTQLNYSFLLLIGTLIGMSIIYLAAPICLILGVANSNWLIVSISIFIWLLMSIAYLPSIKLYNLSFIWVFSLPAIALIYNLMTIDSALKYYRGKGGAWKGRTY